MRSCSQMRARFENELHQQNGSTIQDKMFRIGDALKVEVVSTMCSLSEQQLIADVIISLMPHEITMWLFSQTFSQSPDWTGCTLCSFKTKTTLVGLSHATDPE